MKDDLIDDSGFELGMPTRTEMLRHHCDLLCAELETTRRDLRRAHRDIAKLIVMHRDRSTELAALKVEHERLKWTLSEMYSQERERERDTANMGYSYGDHTKGKTQFHDSLEPQQQLAFAPENMP